MAAFMIMFVPSFFVSDIKAVNIPSVLRIDADWQKLRHCAQNSCLEADKPEDYDSSFPCLQEKCSDEVAECLYQQTCRETITYGETLETSRGLVSNDLMTCADAKCPSFERFCLVQQCGWSLTRCLFVRDCIVKTLCLDKCNVNKCIENNQKACETENECYQQCEHETLIAQEATKELDNIEKNPKYKLKRALAIEKRLREVSPNPAQIHDEDHFTPSDKLLHCWLKSCPSTHPDIDCVAQKCMIQLVGCMFDGACLEMGACAANCMDSVTPDERSVRAMDSIFSCSSTGCLGDVPPDPLCMKQHCAAQQISCEAERGCTDALQCLWKCPPIGVPPMPFNTLAEQINGQEKTQNSKLRSAKGALNAKQFFGGSPGEAQPRPLTDAESKQNILPTQEIVA